MDGFTSGGSSYRTGKIVITGYSSPIGNLKYNQWLAEQRAFQMKQRFVGWWNLKPGLIEIQAAPVDWSVVRQIIVQDKRFPGRQSILQILTGNYTDNQRQFLLQKSKARPALGRKRKSG